MSGTASGNSRRKLEHRGIVHELFDLRVPKKERTRKTPVHFGKAIHH